MYRNSWLSFRQVTFAAGEGGSLSVASSVGLRLTAVVMSVGVMLARENAEVLTPVKFMVKTTLQAQLGSTLKCFTR